MQILHFDEQASESTRAGPVGQQEGCVEDGWRWHGKGGQSQVQ